MSAPPVPQAPPDPGSRGRRRPRPTTTVLLRQVPGDSAVHRLWAGTKLVGVAAYGVVLSLVPSWPGILIGAALLVLTCRLAGVTRAALPHPPRWFWVAMLAGAAVTLASGGPPEIAVAGGHVGLGDLELYVRFVCLSAVLVGASLVVGWTTPLAEVAPAVARLGAPLRRLRLPVDEWAVTVALCIRSLPILMDEMRTVLAARRLRPRRARRWWDLGGLADEAVDVMTAALAASLRRAGEMGEAITARGGTGQVAAAAGGPGRADALTLTLVAVACAAAVGLGSL